MLIIILDTILVFLLNIPFGYWRAGTKKYSLQWILAIHIPVPLVILTRILTNIGWAWYTYVFLVSAFFLGQWVGGKIRSYYNSKIESTDSGLEN